MVKMTVQDRKWRAQDDARTLEQAEIIKSDRTRLGAAKREAKSMVTERQEQLNSIKKIAKTTVRKK